MSERVRHDPDVQASEHTFPVESSVPNCLLRAFTKREYAEAFVLHGQIRLGRIDAYRTLEDSERRDNSEGEVRLQVPGPVKTLHLDRQTLRVVAETEAPGLISFSSSWMHPVYAYCMSSTDVARSRLERLGAHVVRIFDTGKMLKDVVRALKLPPVEGREVFSVDFCPVIYNKDAIAPVPSDDRFKLHYSQKPAAFASDCECRLVVCLSGPIAAAPDYLTLNLHRTAEYTELVGPAEKRRDLPFSLS